MAGPIDKDELQRRQGARLTKLRERAGCETATEAAAWLRARGVEVSRDGYLQHENGHRSMARRVNDYAKAFGVHPEWLLDGRNPPPWADAARTKRPEDVPIIGYVGAGAVAHFYELTQGELDRVRAPEWATAETVASEIHGASAGPWFDGWIIFYDDVRSPVTPDLFGEPCIVGLVDGRVLFKEIRPAKAEGLFHLHSQFEEPILNAEVAWAALVKEIRRK
ncbi:MAG: helix-turn-helix transcriptional regulator [Caulobacter sp.]|nr:helix-turn-helix transcriptional regulator [Caulobacter sp.]